MNIESYNKSYWKSLRGTDEGSKKALQNMALKALGQVCFNLNWCWIHSVLYKCAHGK